MSSIRLFLLDALAREDMHGHQLRQLAEQEHVDRWTDISVGGLYGALKRLAADGLIAPRRTEQVGGYPERQVWGISAAGRASLAALREQGLTEVTLRPDPVDLALARHDPERRDAVPGLVAARIETLRALLAAEDALGAHAGPYLTPLEARVMEHRAVRLRAELDWHERLLADLPALLAAEPDRKDPADA